MVLINHFDTPLTCPRGAKYFLLDQTRQRSPLISKLIFSLDFTLINPAMPDLVTSQMSNIGKE